MFEHVDAYGGDPILTLVEHFKQDPRKEKVNLSIGLYYDDSRVTPQLNSITQAKQRYNAQDTGASLYLPMEGFSPYRSAVQTLLLGDDSGLIREGRVATIQTLGGSGALKIGADFLHRYFQDRMSGSVIRHGKTIRRSLPVPDSKLIIIRILIRRPKA